MIRLPESDRRNFLAGSAATAGLASVIGCTAAEETEAETTTAAARPYEGKLGLQLYTVRDLFEADYAATLTALAEIGYKDCETAGFFEHNPADVKSLMNDLGLESNSGHVRIEQFQDSFAEALETADTMGQTLMVLPWIEESLRTPDSYREIADLLSARGEEAKAAGKQVAYHNHDFEFFEIDGERGYDILLERADPELVKMELDFYWVEHANEDILEVLNRAPGRFIASHLKDRAKDGSMAAVGDGTIDFASILPQAAELGMERFYVEHDNPEEPLVSVGRSYA